MPNDTFQTHLQSLTRPSTLLSIPQVLRLLETQGDPVPTGFAAIDRQLQGGGMPPGTVLLLGGPPEAGKTTLLCQMAEFLSRSFPTACLFKDQGRSQAVIRVCRQLGYSREDLIAGKVTDQVEASTKGSYLWFADPDERGMSLELLIRQFNEVHPYEGKVRILVLDSVQTILTRIDGNADTERGRLVELMETLRIKGREEELIILCSSRVSRGFYQRKDANERHNAAGSFSGSSSMEYDGDVALVIHPKNSEGVSRVEWTKNRLKLDGEPHDFYVKTNHEAAKMEEVDQETLDEDRAGVKSGRTLDAEHQILKALANGQRLQDIPLQKVAGIGRALYLEARRSLKEQRRIHHETEGQKVYWRVSLASDLESSFEDER